MVNLVISILHYTPPLETQGLQSIAQESVHFEISSFLSCFLASWGQGSGDFFVFFLLMFLALDTHGLAGFSEKKKQSLCHYIRA